MSKSSQAAQKGSYGWIAQNSAFNGIKAQKTALQPKFAAAV
jgi:hypothetical protein